MELMNNRRDFLTRAAAGLTALSVRRVLGVNDRLTGAFIAAGTMGTEKFKLSAPLRAPSW